MEAASPSNRILNRFPGRQLRRKRDFELRVDEKSSQLQAGSGCCKASTAKLRLCPAAF